MQTPLYCKSTCKKCSKWVILFFVDVDDGRSTDKQISNRQRGISDLVENHNELMADRDWYRHFTKVYHAKYCRISLTHFRPIFHLQINQVVGFY